MGDHGGNKWPRQKLCLRYSHSSTNRDVPSGRGMLDLLSLSLTVCLSAAKVRPNRHQPAPGHPEMSYSGSSGAWHLPSVGYSSSPGSWGSEAGQITPWERNTELLLWPQRILPICLPRTTFISFPTFVSYHPFPILSRLMLAAVPLDDLFIFLPLPAMETDGSEPAPAHKWVGSSQRSAKHGSRKPSHHSGRSRLFCDGDNQAACKYIQITKGNSHRDHFPLSLVPR